MAKKRINTKKLLNKLDAFAKPPTLFYRGEPTIGTRVGLIYTILMALVLLVFFLHDVTSHPRSSTNQYKKMTKDAFAPYDPFSNDDLELSFGIQLSLQGAQILTLGRFLCEFLRSLLVRRGRTDEILAVPERDPASAVPRWHAG